MKRAILIVMCFMGLSAIAQRGENSHRDTFKDLTPEQMATLQTKRMTLALDLDEKQQSKIKAINLEQAQSRKAKMEERKAARESGESKKPTAEERFAMQNERLDKMIAHKAEMKSILSDEQYQRWEKMMQHKGKRMKKRIGDRKERHSKR